MLCLDHIIPHSRFNTMLVSTNQQHYKRIHPANIVQQRNNNLTPK